MNISTRPEPAPVQGLYADHQRIYPKDVHGAARRVKWALLTFCLFVYYSVPWLRWDRGPGLPDQAILLDLSDERFYIFNLVLWPQDIYILTLLLITAAVSLFLVTSLFGRIWCGYTCPQTVWTDLFLLVERMIEGDRNARMRRDAAPRTFDAIRRKTIKHGIWIFIAFWTGGAWTMYFVDAPHAVAAFWSGTAAYELYAATGLLTVTTYLLAGWAREQVCTYMCPWPRFQSAMLDEQSLIVTYQSWRGEPRGHGRRTGSAPAAGLGDCVDCRACVHVCPTGIDIRDGLQLECIGCGLCVDACNEVMRKMGAPSWLITWDTIAGQAARRAGQPARYRLLRPRTMVYAAVLCVSASALIGSVALRSRATLSLIHDRAPLAVMLRDGSVRNGYTLKLANKTLSGAVFDLSLSGLPGARMMTPEQGTALSESVPVTLPRSAVGTFRILIQTVVPQGAPPSLPIVVTAQARGAATTVRTNALFFTTPKGMSTP